MNNESALPNGNIIYIPHGGGPLPLMGEPNHQDMVNFLTRLPTQIKKPSAIIMISAHWEEKVPTITSGTAPELIYDYHGFPPEAYNIQYPAAGHPELAAELHDLLKAESFDAEMDNHRGFDHGMFVPLKIMYPEADIPCIQLSLIKGLDASAHLKMGKAIAKLASKNILILGSGMSFHNMQAMMSQNPSTNPKSQAFTNWLIDTLATDALNNHEREQKLINWQQAPHASFCHPREEHLLPLHVCFGMAMKSSQKAEIIYQGKLMQQEVLSFRW